ncbi:hypothetical protein C8A05DRAFT_37650 [Staphylotrichum tortipilum]|uniref:Uncharacterized protein n=1 Tax=Staphylotrichum tortipilum TaxID=2831512 RepID=A0AAN6RQS9_9PEZI|nr:hypothetical protein C8A05DRAFT_37650 [Staphylotrichum longicolle]
MPTVDAPKLQPPMAVANPARLQQSGRPGETAIVSQQPAREPRPSMDNDLHLRGGGFHLGFTCCHGRCHYRCC